jgi:hypothetical protein
VRASLGDEEFDAGAAVCVQALDASGVAAVFSLAGGIACESASITHLTPWLPLMKPHNAIVHAVYIHSLLQAMCCVSILSRLTGPPPTTARPL